MVLVEVGFLIKFRVTLHHAWSDVKVFKNISDRIKYTPVTLQGFLGQDCEERQEDIRKKDAEWHQDYDHAVL